MILGPRVRLRRPERSDLPLFLQWVNDPDVRAGISIYLPISFEEEEKWYEGMLSRPVEERPFTVEIPHEDGWRAIGNTSFFSFDWVSRAVEFGIMIGDKRVWNQGYGTEVTKLMLDHAFGTLNLNRMMLRVYSNNPGARRAYEKSGFIHEGVQREAGYMDGIYVDMEMMSVLRREWLARKET